MVVFSWCGLLVMKTGTLIYRGLWTSWTTEIVGAMWTTGINIMFQIIKFEMSLPLHKVRSFLHFSPVSNRSRLYNLESMGGIQII